MQLQPVEGSIVRGTAYSIGLGTHAENAKHLAYGLAPTDLKRDAVPIGVSLPLLRAHRLQPARGGELPLRLLVRRVHQEGLLLLAFGDA